MSLFVSVPVSDAYVNVLFIYHNKIILSACIAQIIKYNLT